MFFFETLDGLLYSISDNLARLEEAHRLKNEANRISQDVDNELGKLKANIAALKNRSSNAVHYGVGGEFGFKAAQAHVSRSILLETSVCDVIMAPFRSPKPHPKCRKCKNS